MLLVAEWCQGNNITLHDRQRVYCMIDREHNDQAY